MTSLGQGAPLTADWLPWIGDGRTGGLRPAVGKLDAIADRRAGEFRVNAIHRDVPFTKAMTAGIDDQIGDLARWVGLPVTRQPTAPRP
jgi:uncharacterized protein YcaQ